MMESLDGDVVDAKFSGAKTASLRHKTSKFHCERQHDCVAAMGI